MSRERNVIIPQELYDRVCSATTNYECAFYPEEKLFYTEDMYNVLVEIQKVYNEGEQI